MGIIGCNNCKCSNKESEDKKKELKLSDQNTGPIIISVNNRVDINDSSNNKEPYTFGSQNINLFAHKSDENFKNTNNNSCSVMKKREEMPINSYNIIVNDEYKNFDENENCFEEKNYNLKLKNKQNNTNMTNSNEMNTTCKVNKRNVENDNNFLIENKPGCFFIQNSKEAKKKIKTYEINKIVFGMEKDLSENLNEEEKKLYKEAEMNLKQFFPAEENELNHLQKIMGNIIINLKNIFGGKDLCSIRDDNNYILFNGILKKMINYEINAHKTTMYSDRFCVLYPRMLKYYKSKVQFLKNLKPICLLPISHISRVNIAKKKINSKKIDHIILCNKFGIQKDPTNNIFLNLFDPNDISSYLSSPEINESLLIFTSDDEETIYKWYVIIQFLIENCGK